MIMILDETKKIIYARLKNSELRVIFPKDENDNCFDFTVPYDSASFDGEVTTNDVDEQVQEIFDAINGRLDSMIDHLGDCQLSLY